MIEKASGEFGIVPILEFLDIETFGKQFDNILKKFDYGNETDKVDEINQKLERIIHTVWINLSPELQRVFYERFFKIIENADKRCRELGSGQLDLSIINSFWVNTKDEANIKDNKAEEMFEFVKDRYAKERFTVFLDSYSRLNDERQQDYINWFLDEKNKPYYSVIDDVFEKSHRETKQKWLETYLLINGDLKNYTEWLDLEQIEEKNDTELLNMILYALSKRYENINRLLNDNKLQIRDKYNLVKAISVFYKDIPEKVERINYPEDIEFFNTIFSYKRFFDESIIDKIFSFRRS